MAGRGRSEALVKVKKSKTMSTILSFNRILYLQQKNNILRCFCSLKFEKNYIATSFPVVYFVVRGQCIQSR